MKNFKKRFMKEKLLAFLKGKLQGTSESYLNGIADFYAKTITDETQIDTTLNDGVIDLLRLNAGILQVEGDRRATEAQKTAVRNAFEKLGLDETGKPKGTTAQPASTTQTVDPNSTEAILKRLLDEKITPLQEKILGFEKEKTQSQMMGKLTSRLKEKGISESFYKGRNLAIESEADIDTLATTIEADFDAFRQEQADSGVVLNTPKAGDGGKTEGALGARIAEAQNAGKSGGAEGKKIEIIH